MDEYYFKSRLGNYVAPGGKISGFVFTNLDEGTKAFNVDIVGEDNQLRGFTFFIPVPGIRADHHDIDWENLYSEGELVDCDENALRTALENMPCCTTNKKGTEQGDPLNLVVIGDLEDVYYAFIRAGWDETESIYRASVLKTIRSFLFGGRYRYSPISALYVFGGPQDLAFKIIRLCQGGRRCRLFRATGESYRGPLFHRWQSGCSVGIEQPDGVFQCRVV